MNPSTIPSADIMIAGTAGKAGRMPAFGRDIVINPRILSDYCFQPLHARVDDLLHVAAAVAFADRTVRRHASYAWRRRINLCIAVREPDFWNLPDIRSALIDCLSLVTGDIWTVVFSSGRPALSVNPQAPLDLKAARSVVLPFSDGLDSLAAARLHAVDHPEETLVLVTSGAKKDVDRAFRIKTLNARRYRVAVPFGLPKNPRFRQVESTYRARGFVFNVVVATAAYLLESQRVIVPESGQGSIGPALIPVGNEAPDMRMHPVFTHRLSRFLERVLGRYIRFEHPYLRSTKGQTLDRLRREGLAEDWWETRSCARDQRHVHFKGQRVQCGVCAACLLRRQSLLAATLDERREKYLWSDLTVARLEDAGLKGARKPRKNDFSQAYCSVLACEELARCVSSSDAKERLHAASMEIAAALNSSADDMETDLMRLLNQHQEEWETFVAKQGTRSFLARWAEMARC